MPIPGTAPMGVTGTPPHFQPIPGALGSSRSSGHTQGGLSAPLGMLSPSPSPSSAPGLLPGVLLSPEELLDLPILTHPELLAQHSCTNTQERLIINGNAHRDPRIFNYQRHQSQPAAPGSPLPTQQIHLGFTELPLLSLCFLFISPIIAHHSWEAPSVIQGRLPGWLLGTARVCCSIDLPSCVLQ